jgi:hypothetical protein
VPDLREILLVEVLLESQRSKRALVDWLATLLSFVDKGTKRCFKNGLQSSSLLVQFGHERREMSMPLRVPPPSHI